MLLGVKGKYLEVCADSVSLIFCNKFADMLRHIRLITLFYPADPFLAASCASQITPDSLQVCQKLECVCIRHQE